ncbi:MAG: hypothetical protein QM696_01495 [Steroidobacteraceae bacterium]
MLPRASGLAAVLLLSACSALDGFERPAARSAVAAPPAEVLQAAQISSYLTSLQQLVQGSPAEQAEVLAGARLGYEANHEGPALLRYGLVLAAPGHPGHDPAQAQRLLREALSRPELLNLAERALAVVELQRVDDELRLAAENQRLVAETQRERERQKNVAPNATTARRLQVEMEENARLRKALEEARAKLDAIANIERSISDRPSANEGRTP